MSSLLKVVVYPLVFAMLLTACGGGGGSSPPVDNTPPTPTLSNDASLSDLTVSTGSFNENFSSNSYTYTQDTGATELSVTPTLSDSNASVSVNGVTVASGSASSQIALALGSNSISVVVTAEDGSTTQTYTVNINRLSNDASLSALTLSSGDLDQTFQPSTETYSGTIGFLVSSASVTATTSNSGANLTINGVTSVSGVPSELIALAEGINTITITVTADDGVTTRNYAVNLTRQTVNVFAQQTFVKASNAGHTDLFGLSVAIFEDTLAVGARWESSAATGINGNEEDNSAYRSGAVYVFTRDGAGLWSQEAYIKASNTNAGDNFGYSVALSGNTLAVGALNESSSTSASGAVYLFARDGAGLWSQEAYIKASTTGGGFGASVALWNDTLAVGFPHDADSSTSESLGGAVLVFARDGAGLWSQQASLKASNSEAGDLFGWSVALSGDTLAAGAVGAEAVYVFARDGAGLWSQEAYITASNTGMSDYFGYSVALSEDTLAVGAYGEDSMVNGDETNNAGFETGAAYVFVRDSAGVWSQQAYIKASSPGISDQFGKSVALSEDTLAVAAYFEESGATGINGNEEDNSASQAGAVYVFTRDGAGLWSQKAYLKASNPDPGDLFGRSVALYGDTLTIGAIGEDSAVSGIDSNEVENSGAVYIFQ